MTRRSSPASRRRAPRDPYGLIPSGTPIAPLLALGGLAVVAILTLGLLNGNLPFVGGSGGGGGGGGGPDATPAPSNVVVVPVGDGVILSGVAKGFADLVRCGLAARSPRLIAVQPENSSAIARAWQIGADHIRPHKGAHSVADSLTVEAPRGASLCLRSLRDTGGAAVTVSDDEILAAIPELASTAGVFAEPAAAAALAGLRRGLAAGVVEPSETAVLLVTGSGLKDVPSAALSVSRPEPIEPTLQATALRLGL